MPMIPSPYEDLDIFTLSDLATQTGIPRTTLRAWVEAGQMHCIKVDGIVRSTRAEVERAAMSQKKRRPRGWELAPLEECEALASIP